MNRWIMARKLLLWYQHRCETSIVVLFRSKNANSLQTISCAVLHFYAVEKKNEIEIESEFLWRCYYVPPVESWSLNLQHTHTHTYTQCTEQFLYANEWMLFLPSFLFRFHIMHCIHVHISTYYFGVNLRSMPSNVVFDFIKLMKIVSDT